MEKLHTKMDSVMMSMLDEMTKNGVADEGMSKLVTNYAKLYELRQRDIETERKFDDQHEKMTYDNGRLDLELRVKEEEVKNEQRKLDLDERKLDIEEKKIETDVRLSEAKLKSDRGNTVVLAVMRGIGTGFKIWLSSCLMHYDASGHVIGTILGKKTLDRWATEDEKF